MFASRPVPYLPRYSGTLPSVLPLPPSQLGLLHYSRGFSRFCLVYVPVVFRCSFDIWQDRIEGRGKTPSERPQGADG